MALGALGIAAVIAAAAVVRLGPLVLDDVLGTSGPALALSFVLRWTIALVLMAGLLATLLRFAPEIERSPLELTVGSVSIVGAWAVSTLAFGVYLNTIAGYQSVFGNLATVFVLVEYLYGASVIFLGGAVIDAIMRKREG